MRFVTVISFFLFFMACKSTESIKAVEDKQAYENAHTIWKNMRVRDLTAPEGWLSLEGLYWLKEGKNTLGSHERNDFKLPHFAADDVGTITWDGSTLKFDAGGESYVTLNDERFISGEIQTDADGTPTKLQHKSLIFYVIKRGDKLAIRLKDTLGRKRYKLKSIPSYDINYDLILNATVQTSGIPESLQVEDVTGTIQTMNVVGKLNFKLADKNQNLLAFDGGDDYYFIIFKDLTSGESTYGGGRYMYVPREASKSKTVTLDFNRAFNPPCAFTDYATCPIPPAQNMLDFAINAGEKYPIY